jgi:hypothetical protein
MWLEAQEKKRKAFVVQKRFGVTVLVGRFNLISRVSSVENTAPSFPSSHVSSALTFDYKKMKILVQYLSTSLAAVLFTFFYSRTSCFKSGLNNFRSSKAESLVLRLHVRKKTGTVIYLRKLILRLPET